METVIVVKDEAKDDIEEDEAALVKAARCEQGCTNFTWYENGLHLSFSNVYDPAGHLRYSCDQMRKVIESIP